MHTVQKKNQCVDSSPLYFPFFHRRIFLTPNEGTFSSIFQETRKQGFYSLTPKSEFTKFTLIDILFHRNSIQIMMKFSCYGMGLFNSFRFMLYSGERFTRPLFAHIGQMIPIPLLFFATTYFFILLSSASTNHWNSIMTSAIDWRFEVAGII